MHLRLATRGSALALAQAGSVAGLLEALGHTTELVVAERPVPDTDKARFVRGVESALQAGEADLGVHSAKDLPAEETQGLDLVAVPTREDRSDAWIARDGQRLQEIPAGARVGTASLRRRAQLLAARPDLQVEELRGNIDTRLAKLAGGGYDAIVLATSGLKRLGREGEISACLGEEEMLSSPGQGALALQVRGEDQDVAAAAESVGDPVALVELLAERAWVRELGAGCDWPVAASAELRGQRLTLSAFVARADGSQWIRDRASGDPDRPEQLGQSVARRMIATGAAELLETR